VAHARDWFHQFGLELDELPVLKRGDAMSDRWQRERGRADSSTWLVGIRAGRAGFARIKGVARDVRGFGGTARRWQDRRPARWSLQPHPGASVWPNRFNRRPANALGLLTETAVLPHYDAFGSRWVESAQAAAPMTLLGVDERSAAVWRDGTWRAMGPWAA